MVYLIENFPIQKIENEKFTGIKLNVVKNLLFGIGQGNTTKPETSRVILTVSDSSSLDINVPKYIIAILAIPFGLILIILITVAIVLAIVISLFDFVKNLFFPPYQPSYEEAIKWFEDDNSYLQNLSKETKEKFLVKQDLPLTWYSKCTSLIKTLNTYLTLPNDWDGYDGVAPTTQTIQDCIFFVKQLPQSIKVPKPMIGGSGTVGLYWEKDDIYAEVCFEGDSTFWYYGTDGKFEIGEESITLIPDMQFPVALYKLLQKISLSYYELLGYPDSTIKMQIRTN
ncbi:MAG: hypothetical protein J7647_15570 [Cyanobacteria bacterium SBLK]|nr:hypothetical protein [Cyanobacteria bacterium SBLK]